MTAISRPPVRWGIFAALTPLALAALLAALATSPGPGDPRVLAAGAVVGLLAIGVIAVVPPSWSLSAALALSMFGSNWGLLGLPASVAPDRLVLGFTLLAMAVRAPGSRDRVAIRARPLVALMYVAGAYAIASSMAAGTITQHAAIFDLLDRMEFLDWLVLIIAPCAFTTAADRRVLLGTLVGMGVYLGLTGIAEIIGPHALVFPRYIENPHAGIQFGRARGPFVQATINGLALYASLLASLIALREWRGRRPRLVAMLAIAVCALSLLLTFQRTVWIGVAVSALCVLIFVPEARRRLIAAGLAVLLMVGVAFLAVPAVRRHAATRAADVQTVRDRQALDSAAINMIVHRPLFGFGWERFIRAAPDYYVTSDAYPIFPERPIPVHDVYLSIATELGLVGLALWLLIVLIGVGGAVLSRRGPPEVRPWRIALGALFVMWLVAGVSSPLAGAFQSLVVWLLAAVVVGAELGHRDPGGAAAPRRLAP